MTYTTTLLKNIIFILCSNFRYFVVIGLYWSKHKDVSVFLNIDLFSSLKSGLHFENGNLVLLQSYFK